MRGQTSVGPVWCLAIAVIWLIRALGMLLLLEQTSVDPVPLEWSPCGRRGEARRPGRCGQCCRVGCRPTGGLAWRGTTPAQRQRDQCCESDCSECASGMSMTRLLALAEAAADCPRRRLRVAVALVVVETPAPGWGVQHALVRSASCLQPRHRVKVWRGLEQGHMPTVDQHPQVPGWRVSAQACLSCNRCGGLRCGTPPALRLAIWPESGNPFRGGVL
jgi:hypothetical protein